jgi:AcrR family transcriptional regulator
MPAAYSPPISPRHIAAGGQYFQWKYPIGAPAGLVKRNISSVNIRMRKPSPRAKSEPKLKPKVRSKARAEVKPYHHGDLKSAVLAAAEKLLEAEGVDALTLRAVARMVGVSHTAPKNHFGDLEGLLSELAAVGYRRFGAALTAAMDDAGADPRQRLRAMGLAYVAFARAYPNLFVLMYRSDRLDMNAPGLRGAIEGTRQSLRNATTSAAPGVPLAPLQLAARATASWALVHGFAMLLLDGRLRHTLASLPGDPDANALLEAVLDVTRVND